MVPSKLSGRLFSFILSRYLSIVKADVEGDGIALRQQEPERVTPRQFAGEDGLTNGRTGGCDSVG